MNEKRIEQLLEQIENDPDNLSLYIQYKNICIQSKLYEEAEIALEELINRVNFALEEALESTGEVPDLDLGESIFRFLAKSYYEWGEVVKNFSSGREEDAIELFKASIESDETFDKAYQPLGELYLGNHSYDEWLEVEEKALDYQKNKRVKIDTLLKMRDVAEKLGEMDRVIKYYHILMVDDKPRSKDYFLKLEKLLLSLEEWSQLAKLYEEKLKERLDPKTKQEVTEKLVDIYQNKIPNKDKVFFSLCENYKKNPKNDKLRDQLEEVVENANMHEELLSFYETIVETIPDRNIKKHLLTKIADILYDKLNENDEAYQSYEKILEVSPNDPYAIKRMVELLSEKEKTEEIDKKLIEFNNILGHYYLIREKNEQLAVDSYYNVLQVDPLNDKAFAALSKIFKSKKMWGELAEVMKIRVEKLEGEDKARIAYMLGELIYKNIGDKKESSKYFKIAYDSGESRAISYIETIAKENENYDDLLQYKIDSIEHIKMPREKAKALKEIGDIFQNRMMDADKALHYFIQSLKFNYKDMDLAIKVLEYSYDSGNYGELKEILTEMDRAIALKKDSSLYFKLAQIAYDLDEKDKAAVFYKKSSDLDKKNYDILWALASLYKELKEWKKGLRVFQFIEMNFKTLDDDKKFSLYSSMGETYFNLGDKKAQKYLEQALDISRANIETLTIYYKLLDTQGEYQKGIAVRLEIVDLIDDKEKLITLYTNIADIYKNKLNNEKKYLQFYNEIYKLGANDKDQLMFLLDSYTRTHNYKEAVGVILRLIEIEKDNEIKIDYKFELLNIYKNGLKNYKKVLLTYKELYDELPDDPEVIQGYETYLKKLKVWPQLITFYIDRIKRVDSKEHKSYWLTIADIYANQLKDFKQAATALEQAVRLDSSNIKLRMALSDIYFIGNVDYKKQLELLRKNIKDAPTFEANYQKLFSIFLKMKKVDEAYVVARIIRYLGKLTKEQKTILSNFKGKNKLEWGQILTKYHWDLITHHRLKNQVTDIFYAITPPMAKLYSKFIRMNPKEMVDIGKDKTLFSSVYQMISTFLNIPAPELYVKQGVSGFNFINGDNLYIQAGYDLYNSTNDKELLFHLGKGMTYLRPEFVLAKIVPGSVIKNIFLGVLNYVIPTMNVAGDLDQLQAIKTHFEKKTAPETVESIQMVVEDFVAAKGSIDLNKWLNAVEFTSNRISFILTQDYSLLDTMFRRETVGVLSKADIKMKMADILNFSISDDYFTLRKELGLKVR